MKCNNCLRDVHKFEEIFVGRKLSKIECIKRCWMSVGWENMYAIEVEYVRMWLKCRKSNSGRAEGKTVTNPTRRLKQRRSRESRHLFLRSALNAETRMVAGTVPQYVQRNNLLFNFILQLPNRSGGQWLIYP